MCVAYRSLMATRWSIGGEGCMSSALLQFHGFARSVRGVRGRVGVWHFAKGPLESCRARRSRGSLSGPIPSYRFSANQEWHPSVQPSGWHSEQWHFGVPRNAHAPMGQYSCEDSRRIHGSLGCGMPCGGETGGGPRSSLLVLQLRCRPRYDSKAHLGGS